MQVYVTADPHGEFRRIAGFCRAHHTSREDLLIVLGDAGINYFDNSTDHVLKQVLSKIPITFFCVHGNHEMRPTETTNSLYKEISFEGGRAYVEEEFPNIFFAKDGEIYNIQSQRTLVVGGAYSLDKMQRLACGMRWFSSEQPDAEIKKRVESNIKRAGGKLDCILSHTIPRSLIPKDMELLFGDTRVNDNPCAEECLSADDRTEIWLDEQIYAKADFKRWFCGHLHLDQISDKDRRVRMVHRHIITFNEKRKQKIYPYIKTVNNN